MRKPGLFPYSVAAIMLMALLVTLLTGSCSQNPKSADSGQADGPVAVIDPASRTGPSWTVIRDIQLKHGSEMEGFLNEDIGITVGEIDSGGEIHYTTDGGINWTLAKGTSTDRLSLDIVDENLMWTSGEYYAINYSVDGGRNWLRATDTGAGKRVHQICFIDDKTGWTASALRLMSTRDGAMTWNEIEKPDRTIKIAAISLRTANDGYLLTLDGLLYITNDGGKSWTSHDLQFNKFNMIGITGEEDILMQSDSAIADISFTDEKNGTIVFISLVRGAGYKPWCLVTSDGCSTWIAKPITMPEGYQPSALFLTKDAKYMTCSDIKNRVLVLKRDD